MMRKALFLTLLIPAFAAASDTNCGSAPAAGVPASAPAPEMTKAGTAAGDCARLDAVAFAERSRRPAAAPAARPAQAAPQTAQAGGSYQPKTKDDNTPWRFDMNQNGRRMTAEEFDAWMKAKGIRVATGKPAETAPAASASTTGN